MSINRLYRAWFDRIRQLRPGEHITRLRNLAWMLVGIHESKSVHLSKVALEIPGEATTPSITRRLIRLLSNPAIRVREWCEPTAKRILQSMAEKVGEIRLIADGTKVGFGHQLLMVALAFPRRAVPIAWTWVRTSRGHCSAIKLPALLAYVRGLIPAQKPVKHAHPTNLLAHWKRGEKEPWLLATNLLSRQKTLSAYRRRMWIEEVFGDLKGNGFDHESTHLRHFLRLSRLTLAVALPYVWLISTGSKAIKNGQRHSVDRTERRDLSSFQIGLRLVRDV